MLVYPRFFPQRMLLNFLKANLPVSLNPTRRYVLGSNPFDVVPVQDKPGDGGSPSLLASRFQDQSSRKVTARLLYSRRVDDILYVSNILGKMQVAELLNPDSFEVCSDNRILDETATEKEPRIKELVPGSPRYPEFTAY